MDELNIRVRGDGETVALLDKLVDTGMLEELVNPEVADRFFRITPVGDRFLEKTHELVRLAGRQDLAGAN
jgi:hypothetical protein